MGRKGGRGVRGGRTGRTLVVPSAHERSIKSHA